MTVPADQGNVGGDGKNTDPGKGTENPTKNKEGDGNGGQNTGGKSEDEGSPPDKKFTQEDLDRIASKVRDEEKRKHEKQLSDAKAEAERKQAEEQGQYKELYDKTKAELETTKAKADAADRYAEHLHTLIDTEIKEWPEEVRELDPGKDSLDARIGWVNKCRGLAERVKGGAKAPSGEHGQGNRDTPSPSTAYMKRQYGRPKQ